MISWISMSVEIDKANFTNLELNRQLRKLNELFLTTKNYEPDDDLHIHLTKYICVLCSGFIENSIFQVFSDIATKNSTAGIVLSYTKSQLLKLQNTNSEKIRKLAKSFNANWYTPLNEYLQENDRGAAINAILKSRHKIAHGKDSDITIRLLESYMIKTIEVIIYLETNLV